MSLEALKRNGHRLELGSFPAEGEYDIPVLKPFTLEKRLQWVRFNHALTIPKAERSKLGVHFFLDDYLFERAWREPRRYALFLREFAAVMSPDFSMFTDYPKAVQIYNHWRKHYLAAYWQNVGVTVIPSICWADEASYDWCFDGEPTGSTVAISTVGTQKGKANKEAFFKGFTAMMDKLSPSKIVLHGTVPDNVASLAKERHSEIESHTPFYETFTKGLAFSDNAR